MSRNSHQYCYQKFLSPKIIHSKTCIKLVKAAHINGTLKDFRIISSNSIEKPSSELIKPMEMDHCRGA